ncbi:MAG: pyridoxal phosphate-dependent aminotransferase [Clostridium lundense]|nr:pyridoxal phosphate-dependent aminotransferase [Clostridium lundense]
MKGQLAQMQISEKAKSIPEALSVYMNNIVYEMKRRGKKVKVLSLGEAFFDIPFFPFGEEEFEKGCHYSESRGLPELRKSISNYYWRTYHASVDDKDEILISAGSKALIFMAFQAVLNCGDEVLIHEPAWLSYTEEVKLADGVPRFIPYDCPVEGFERYFSEKTKMVVICNPNNPVGRIYRKEELEKIYSICRPRGIYVLVDEAYSDFAAGDGFTSMINIVPDKDGVIVVNSLSKNLGISGWRIGYVISTSELIYHILKLNQHLITCPPTLLSLYLAQHYECMVSTCVPQAKMVARKRQLVTEYMQSIGLRPLEGAATFYIFMDIGAYKRSSLDLSLYLLTKHGISVVPGVAYGESTDRFIRLSVGTEKMEDIKECLKTLNKVISEDEYDGAFVETELATLHMDRFVIKK